MRFNRRLKPFKAISFDLDDTLYHNGPVMLTTIKKMVDYFADKLPARQSGNYDHHYWGQFRQQLLKSQPRLANDVGQMRLHCYFLGIKALGFSQADARVMAEQALAYFIAERSNFEVPKATLDLLATLKQRWPLVAITNGNVDTSKIGLRPYFDAVYSANQDMQLKPSADMFSLACLHLGITSQQLLHVGDCGHSDIYGANRFGGQSAWLSCYQIGKPITTLPTIELTELTELYQLLDNR